MSMTATKASLEGLTKELLGKWAQTKECWLDAKSREFEQRFMDELVANASRAAAGIHELDKLVTKVRSDCE